VAGILDTALSFIGLGSIPEQGAKSKSSDTRLKSANDARRLLQACLKEDNSGRSLERAIVKGCCVDGNPPYPEPRPADRKWEANLNLGKGKRIMKRTAVPYFNLFARVDFFADCQTAYQPDNPDHSLWSSAITRRFHNLLKRWDEFSWNVQQISFWMRLHGIGYGFFDTDHNWRFTSVETGNVLVPAKSRSCLDKRIPYVFVRMPYRILELWEKIKDEGTAKAKGWNIEATRNAIKFGMKGIFPPSANNDWYGRPWEEYQTMLTNHELTASFTDGDIVYCAIMLLQEYSGKISKFIFTENEVASEEVVKTNPTASPSNDMFLFADPNCYDKYLEVLVPFFRDTGDGTWHSVRGYAQESFKHIEIENRTLCQGLNRAFLNSCVAMQFPNERARTMSQLSVQGTVVKLPVGSEWKQIFMQGGIEDLVVMQRLLSNHLDDNIGVVGPRTMSREDGKGEQPTARQIDYTTANEASIGEAEITNYYGQKDAVYAAMFARASDPTTSDEEAKRFQKECEQDGVPIEALQDMEYVRANRQNGYGSPELGIMKFNQSKDLVGMFPEDGKQKWLEEAVTSIHGPEKTKAFVPRQHIPDDQDWQAGVENEMFANGRTPIVSTGQNDVIHLTSHIADAKQFLGPFADQIDNGGKLDPADLEKALTYVKAAGPNIEQHVQRLQNDPTRKQEATMFNDEFQNLVSFSGKLFVAYRRAQRQIRLEQEQAGQATALSALDQAKVQSVRTQTALAAQKTQSQIENQRAKTVQGMGIKEAKARQDIRLAAHKHAIEVPAEVISR
jgi:hypothetical protein